ncbi:MAG TPA: type II toxin-antitoxin system prevent-host-death family antitoxin [Acidobacteriota bacterium]|nr:type II toxin-antitoxin system prevent-host-death family antitoxin [Acidobacteriota bacterium]
MKTAGIRELKSKISDYLRSVRSGESVVITDRGEAIAEICPLGYSPLPKDLPVALVEMFKKGRLSLGAANDAAAYPALPPVLVDAESNRLLDEERGGR